MKKKVFLSILLVSVLTISLFILTGCGDKNSENKVNNNASSSNGTNANSKDNNTENKVNANDEKFEYDYKNGVLTQIVDKEGKAKQTDFVIDGIILVGNQHSYLGLEAETETIINKLAAQGYKKQGINSSFYLNEWIEFYIDTKYTGANSDVKIIIAPHRSVEDLEKLSLTQLEDLANDNGGYVIDYKTPEVDNYKYVGNGFVNMDYPEGKYDILFTYKGKIAYFINIDLMKQEQ